MNITSYASEFTTQLFHISPSSIPGTLWAYYLTHLVFYEPDSWVATIAHAFRIVALLIAFPIVVLGLLDLASYGIARSLGVIDDVKASTSDKSTIHTTTAAAASAHIQPPPLIQVNGSGIGTDTPASESTFSSDSSDRDSTSAEHHAHHNATSTSGSLRMRRSPLSASTTTTTEEDGDADAGSQPSLYYVGEDGGSKLSGVDVFSPAASMPPSPTLSRSHLAYIPASGSSSNTRTDVILEPSLRHRAPLHGYTSVKEGADDH